MKRLDPISLCVTAAAALLVFSPIQGADGVREINQACVADGCFAGDAPGLPVEITQPGSYLLTSGITVPDENTSGIVSSLSLSDKDLVTIDLNGFGIVGPVTCSGTPVSSCTALAGSGRGVNGAGGNVVVRNGSVSGMGFYGIFGAAVVEQVVASHNRLTGIEATRITRCRAEQNGDSGFQFLGLAEGNYSVSNGGAGFRGGGLIKSNHAIGNGRGGFSTSTNATLVENHSTANDEHGFFLDAAFTAIGNHASRNQFSGFFMNDRDGGPQPTPELYAHGVLTHCTAIDNGDFGLESHATVGFSDCVFKFNGDDSPSSQVTGATQIGLNICGSGLCP